MYQTQCRVSQTHSASLIARRDDEVRAVSVSGNVHLARYRVILSDQLLAFVGDRVRSGIVACEPRTRSYEMGADVYKPVFGKAVGPCHRHRGSAVGILPAGITGASSASCMEISRAPAPFQPDTRVPCVCTRIQEPHRIIGL